MTDRFPLIVDIADGNKIKELPSGDNLNLQNSEIVNATTITTGSLNTTNLTIDNRGLSELAFTGLYKDLDGVPPGFSGDYADLINTPEIPSSIRDLSDVFDVQPNNGQTLVFNSITGNYEPKNIDDQFDITNNSIDDLQDVVLTGTLTNKYLKNQAGAWKASLIEWNEIQNRPLQNSRFENDSGYLNTTSLDSYITTDETITYLNGQISVTADSITTEKLAVDSTGTVGDSLQSTGNGAFVWRNPYVEQETEPTNPLPGDEWLETGTNIYYKYLGGHWIPIVQYNVIETESGTEINTESGDAIDFGDSTG